MTDGSGWAVCQGLGCMTVLVEHEGGEAESGWQVVGS